ncbi:hypothetical protein FA95DRAFT_1607121 [Auriscalpium vulgare]|uniref:Uncharacterized protein n=1 Tax=Auriscalpium vulgare TaxID=40419 RepID=A0ACB8RQB3_9AGAM|nr:hypothetical protein FA95DRAFT_1607121 [Auriscalpium vulgare]
MALNVPLEIQTMIIEWVYKLSQHYIVDYATLRVCALVCKAWTSTAQRLLLRRPFTIFIRPFDRFTNRALLLLHTLHDRPSLATHILTIQIIISDINDTHVDHPQLAILGLCPGVQYIEVDFYSGQKLKPALGARLRSLDLHPVVLSVDGTHEAICNFVEMWPSVRVVDFHLQHESDINDSYWPLRGLSSAEAMSLHHGRSISLLPLDIDDYMRTRVFWTDLLSQIHTLRIVGPFPPAEVFERIARLETLVFSELPGNNAIGLPKTLRRVGYLLNGELKLDNAQDIKPFTLVLRTLPELQHVSATRLSPPHQLAMLHEVCRERGVDFEVFENMYHVWRPQDIDWI